MGETNMKRLSNQIKEQLGWQGVSGIVLLALAGTFLILTLQPLEDETAFMQNHLDAARSKAAMQNRTSSIGDRQEELGLFFDSLPVEQDVTDVLASIYAIAEESGIELKQAEYHLNDKDWPRLEYGMNFPVRGEYGQLRSFVSRVLAENPAVSLDQINFQRDKINTPMLKAEIRLTLFLHTTNSDLESYVTNH